MAGPVADRLALTDGDRGQPRADLPRLRRRRRGVAGGRGRGRAARRSSTATTPDGLTPPALGGHRPGDASARSRADLRRPAGADRRRPPPLRDLPASARRDRHAPAPAPGRGTAAWRCSSTPATTGRRCTRSTGSCRACRWTTRSPGRRPGSASRTCRRRPALARARARRTGRAAFVVTDGERLVLLTDPRRTLVAADAAGRAVGGLAGAGRDACCTACSIDRLWQLAGHARRRRLRARRRPAAVAAAQRTRRHRGAAQPDAGRGGRRGGGGRRADAAQVDAVHAEAAHRPADPRLRGRARLVRLIAEHDRHVRAGAAVVRVSPDLVGAVPDSVVSTASPVDHAGLAVPAVRLPSAAASAGLVDRRGLRKTGVSWSPLVRPVRQATSGSVSRPSVVPGLSASAPRRAAHATCIGLVHGAHVHSSRAPAPSTAPPSHSSGRWSRRIRGSHRSRTAGPSRESVAVVGCQSSSIGGSSSGRRRAVTSSAAVAAAGGSVGARVSSRQSSAVASTIGGRPRRR